MTLNQIAAEIDLLLQRFIKAREILATLAPGEGPPVEERVERMRRSRAAAANAPAMEPEASSETADPAAQETAATQVEAPAKKQRAAKAGRVARVAQAPRAPKRRAHVPLATALHGTIPHGPVVVSADAVRSRATPIAASREPQRQPTADPGHSLDDLVRELTRRSDPLSAVRPSSV